MTGKIERVILFIQREFTIYVNRKQTTSTIAAHKHQDNGIVDRHQGTIIKLANTRLSQKIFYCAVKYSQFMHDVILIKDSTDKNGLQYNPYEFINNIKPNSNILELLNVLVYSRDMK